MLLAGILAPDVASAALDHGTARGTEAAASAAWGAAPSPATLTWGLGSAARQTATVANTGGVALTAMTYKVVMSNGLTLSTWSLAACATPWVAGLCNGGTGSAVGGTYRAGTTTTVTSTLVPPVGGSSYLQATASSVPALTVTMTLTITVAGRSQTRTPVVTNR
ncbi:MAG TPA: hypothetical protein VEI83_11880 [Acidimicrobiales bacterium]|nr:hypothetical protein [Acidimicrobiales bacterium]